MSAFTLLELGVSGRHKTNAKPVSNAKVQRGAKFGGGYYRCLAKRQHQIYSLWLFLTLHTLEWLAHTGTECRKHAIIVRTKCIVQHE